MNYMFDYQCFLTELREHKNPEKKQIAINHDQWSKAATIEEEPFFQDYLSHFSPIEFHTPVELAEDYDWNLLLNLCVASFSSDYFFQFTDESELPELYITVKSGNEEVTKTVSELWSFQILRLFEIFCEEKINLHSLLVQDISEAPAIEAERKNKIKAYKGKIYNLKLDQIKRERDRILMEQI